MGRAPCCDKNNVKRGPWSPEEDAILKCYVKSYGTGGNWIALPKKAGLQRCGKSCRLRWLNYLRPDIKHGGFTEEEDEIIYNLYNEIGSRWSVIASRLPGRTDNDIKNYWNTKLKKKLLGSGKILMTTNPNLFPSNHDGMADGTSLSFDLGLMNEPPNLPFHKVYDDLTMNDVNPEMRSVMLLSQDYSLTSTSNSSPGITAVDSTSSTSFGWSTEEGSFFEDPGMQEIWDSVNKLLFEEEPLIETSPRFYQTSFPSTNPPSFIEDPMNQ